MIYIQKHRTPDIVQRKVSEIINTPDSGYEFIRLPENTKQLRELFENMPKDKIRKELCKEQHGLCAYCMRRIEPKRNSTQIEHYIALSVDKQKALDYQNYLGVCDGGKGNKKGRASVLCCEAVREEKGLTINPRDKRQMEAIGYKRNGEIFVRRDSGLDPELVDNMQKDLDEVLVLNGKKDISGKIVFDTATQLVAHRRSIYDSICTQFERWDKKKCLTKEFLKEKIEDLEKQLQGDRIAEPYIGVKLYFYKRKYKKLDR